MGAYVKDGHTPRPNGLCVRVGQTTIYIYRVEHELRVKSGHATRSGMSCVLILNAKLNKGPRNLMVDM